MSRNVTLRELTAEEYADYRVTCGAAMSTRWSSRAGTTGPPPSGRGPGQDSSLPESGPPAGQVIRLAEHDGVRIGQIWIGPAKDNDPDAPRGHWFGWLNDIEVVEALRGQGWGRALLAAAEQLAGTRATDGWGSMCSAATRRRSASTPPTATR